MTKNRYLRVDADLQRQIEGQADESERRLIAEMFHSSHDKPAVCTVQSGTATFGDATGESDVKLGPDHEYNAVEVPAHVDHWFNPEGEATVCCYEGDNVTELVGV